MNSPYFRLWGIRSLLLTLQLCLVLKQPDNTVPLELHYKTGVTPDWQMQKLEIKWQSYPLSAKGFSHHCILFQWHSIRESWLTLIRSYHCNHPTPALHAQESLESNPEAGKSYQWWIFISKSHHWWHLITAVSLTYLNKNQVSTWLWLHFAEQPGRFSLN